MKQICYDMIESFYWSEEHHVKEKHPQKTMRELGLKLVISIPESLGDCWNCLVENFDFELPSYIDVRDDISWDYFYRFNPSVCVEAMKKCGVDYKAVIRQVEADDKRWAEQRAANKKFADKVAKLLR